MRRKLLTSCAEHHATLMNKNAPTTDGCCETSTANTTSWYLPQYWCKYVDTG